MTDKELTIRLSEIEQVANNLEKMIRKLKYEITLNDEEMENAILEIRIKKYLDELGIPQSLIGYDYLAEEIEAFVLEPKSKLYESSVKKFSQTPARVERAIRWARKRTFEKNSENLLLEKLFGGYAEEPSNKEFIVTVANYIRDRM